MDTVQQIYERRVKPLPVVDRLQLARLIMDDLAASSSRWVVETSEMWSQEDLEDVSRASLLYAIQTLPDGEDEDAESR
jgi:hypothetical protein